MGGKITGDLWEKRRGLTSGLSLGEVPKNGADAVVQEEGKVIQGDQARMLNR